MAHERAAHLAEVQDGLITRQQALATGMSRSAIRHATRPDGPWQRVLPGVIATFNGPLGDLHRLRGAVLCCGGDAVVTGAWACWMAGLTYGPSRGDIVDVLVERANAHRGVGFVRARRANLVPPAVLWLDDAADEAFRHRAVVDDEVLDPLAPSSRPGTIPMAPAARAVIDTVARLDLLPADWSPSCRVDDDSCQLCHDGGHLSGAMRNVRALMCEVVQRRRSTVQALGAALAGAPIRGSGLARAAFADIEAGCRSAPECETRDLVRSSRILPEPRWNQVLPGARGLVPDACWPEARLVIEVDSQAFHGFGDAPARTEHKRARYAALGWRVYPVSPTRLRREPRVVLQEIEAAYLAGRRH